MIEELRITDLGVIESSTLPLGPGLTVVSGETGAGKTMIVTALGLLLGGRADSGGVRTGARQARIEGIVAARSLALIRPGVEGLGGVVEDEGVLLARHVAAEGRSRAFVGGAAVPIAALAELTAPIVAVHGQSDQHRLVRPQAQLDALDHFGGVALQKTLGAYVETYDRLVAAEAELRELVDLARERAREADLLRFGLGEIAALAPESGEDVRLAQEESRLGHADTLRTHTEAAREALSSEREAPDALGAVAAARRVLEAVREHDAEVAGLAERLAEVSYLLSDLAADVASYAADVDVDPARLAAVSERRAGLTALQRKYGDTIEDVLRWSEDAARRLVTLDDSDTRIETLRAERATLRTQLGAAAGELSQLRTDAAADLAARVTEEINALAMPHARLALVVQQRDVTTDGLTVGSREVAFGRTGVDEIEFRLAANPGSEPRSLAKTASGGELSRVMLGLEVVLAGSGDVPTFVFDEVDAGVGGRAATEIGARLARLAKDAQVLVVTHLPQVAAFADRHVLIEKSSDGVVTTSGLTVLDEPGRVRELSRMLAGVEESDSAQAHAVELLEAAQSRSAR